MNDHYLQFCAIMAIYNIIIYLNEFPYAVPLEVTELHG